MKPFRSSLRCFAVPALLATTSIVALASCDRGEAPAPPPRQPAPPPPPALPAAVAPNPEQPAPPAAPDQIIVPTGEWTENKIYRFRLERIAACGAPAATLGPAQPTAPTAVGTLRGDTSWVGAFFRVEAKQPAVFVSPRDLDLRRGGVILNAKHINQPLLSGCEPLLPAKSLKAGENVAGFALFEVPKGFRVKTEDPIVLSYKPTRWGGARRVEVPIRECLDACPELASAKASKTAGRAPSPRHKL